MARPGQNQRGNTAVAENTTASDDGHTVVVPNPPTQTVNPEGVDGSDAAPEAPQTDPQPTTNESGEQGTATPTPQEPAKAAEKAAEKSDDLTAFKATVDAGYEVADEDTGTVPERELQAVVGAYRGLGSKGRAEARKFLNDAMRAYVQEREMKRAQAAVKMSDAMQAGAASKVGRAAPEPVDPTEAFVQRVNVYDLAKRLVVQTVPDGVTEDWAAKAAKLREDLQPQVEVYQAWLKARSEVPEGTEPPAKPDGISPVVESAFKLVQGRGAGLPRTKVAGTKAAFDGPRRSVKAHIKEALATVPVDGFLKVADIVKFGSDEYGNDHPSSGAVTAALESKNKIEGVEAGFNNGVKGAFRRA